MVAHPWRIPHSLSLMPPNTIEAGQQAPGSLLMTMRNSESRATGGIEKRREPMSSQQTTPEPESMVSVGPGSYRIKRPETVDDVIELLQKRSIQIIDLKFTDLPGLWQHFSITLP